MSLRRKLSILAVVCLGGIAVLVSALRIIVALEFLADPDDTTYGLAKLVIMTCVELQVAIVTANMPAVKALWTLWRTGWFQKSADGILPVSSSPIEFASYDLQEVKRPHHYPDSDDVEMIASTRQKAEFQGTTQLQIEHRIIDSESDEGMPAVNHRQI